MKTVILRILLIALAFALLPLASLAQDSSASTADFAGNWKGRWSDAAGYFYSADMQLKAGSDGAILGKINWTLLESPNADEQGKLGMTGIEFVHGKYDPASRVLTFEGVSKTDPDNILGLDKYKLLLADNGNVMGGITLNNGSWRGVFTVTRAESN